MVGQISLLIYLLVPTQTTLLTQVFIIFKLSVLLLGDNREMEGSYLEDEDHYKIKQILFKFHCFIHFKTFPTHS